MISAIDLALNLLQGILASAGVKGLAPEIIKDVEAAVAALSRVKGTPVSYSQLEALRVKPEW